MTVRGYSQWSHISRAMMAKVILCTLLTGDSGGGLFIHSSYSWCLLYTTYLGNTMMNKMNVVPPTGSLYSNGRHRQIKTLIDYYVFLMLHGKIQSEHLIHIPSPLLQQLTHPLIDRLSAPYGKF